MSNKCLVIPKEINRQYIFIWNKDEVLFILLPWIFFFVSIGMLSAIICLILSYIIHQIVRKLSHSRPKGYMMHWIRYNVPKQYISAIFSKKADLELKQSLLFRGETFPPSHIRYIAG